MANPTDKALRLTEGMSQRLRDLSTPLRKEAVRLRSEIQSKLQTLQANKDGSRPFPDLISEMKFDVFQHRLLIVAPSWLEFHMKGTPTLPKRNPLPIELTGQQAELSPAHVEAVRSDLVSYIERGV